MGPPALRRPSLSDLRGLADLPFRAYYWRHDLSALADVLEARSSSPSPSGLPAARRPGGPAGTGRAALIGFGVGLSLELGQAFNPNRYADLTDAFWAGTGTALGFAPVAVGRGAEGEARARPVLTGGPGPAAPAGGRTHGEQGAGRAGREASEHRGADWPVAIPRRGRG